METYLQPETAPRSIWTVNTICVLHVKVLDWPLTGSSSQLQKTWREPISRYRPPPACFVKRKLRIRRHQGELKPCRRAGSLLSWCHATRAHVDELPVSVLLGKAMPQLGVGRKPPSSSARGNHRSVPPFIHNNRMRTNCTHYVCHSVSNVDALCKVLYEYRATLGAERYKFHGATGIIRSSDVNFDAKRSQTCAGVRYCSQLRRTRYSSSEELSEEL